MTREEFWDEDPQLFWAFWDAYEQRKDEEAREANVKAFNQGQYFMLALGQVLQFTKNPKRIYPKKPLEMKSSKKTESKMTQQQYEEIRKIHLQERIARFNSKNNK